MKMLRYFFIAGLILLFEFCCAQEVETELNDFLRSNPDLLTQIPEEQFLNQVFETTTDKQDDELCQANSGELSKVEQAKAKIDAIRFGMNSIFQDQLFLNQSSFANQTELSKLKLVIDAEVSRIEGEIIKFPDSELMFDWYVSWLRDLIFNFKVACLKLEIISVKNNSDEHCFLNPLDFVEFESAKFNVFKRFWSLYCKANPKYDRHIVKKIILGALPTRLKKSFYDYFLLGFTQTSRDACWINKVLNENFYEKYLVLAEGYLDVVSVFYKVKNYQEQIDNSDFIKRIENVIQDFINKNSQNLPYMDKCFLNIYLSKLIKIKNYFIKFYKSESDSEGAKEKSKLLIRFKLLLDNEKIEQFSTDNAFCYLFNLYCNVLHKFFDNDVDLPRMELQLFELGYKIEKSKNDKQSSFFKYYFSKPSEIYVIIDDMLKLLKDVSDFVNFELNKNEKGFFSKLFSGQWIDSGKIKNMNVGGTETILGFIEQIFNRKFDNFKEAAFYLLARMSPAMAAVLIYKVAPYLSGDLQEKVSNFVGNVEQETENLSEDGNKILDFISQNPEVFKKLCEVKPDLVEKLADVVAQNLVVKKI